MKIKEIVEATHGILLCGNPEDEVTRFVQDSRQVESGDMYIPIIGENLDGHQFIQSAFDHGASTIITSVDLKDETHNIIRVKDTTLALGDMARYVRDHHPVKVVGITGSVGKTSTKDMIYSVVSQKFKALKTLGNYNNQIGLPLTILRYHDEEVMVIEMGMNHLKEISYLSGIAKPDIAAITNVGTAHIGEVGGRENILKAKMEIVDGMQKDGILIVNDDNDLLHTVSSDTYTILRVGKHTDIFNPKNIRLGLNGSDFDLTYCNKTYTIHVPVMGEHFVYNALIAIAIGIQLGESMEECIRGVESFELTKNRMDMIELNNHIRLIDGTYNANLDSMKSSIDVLSKHPTRKIAVLADMLELGEYEKDLHQAVGEYFKNKDIDVLLCLGDASEYIIAAAKPYVKKTQHFNNHDNLYQTLCKIIQPGDTVLLKGSNGMNLKSIVNQLTDQYK